VNEGSARLPADRLSLFQLLVPDTFNGAIVRRSTGTCVVELKGQIREGRLVPFASLDILELKAGLLNHGR
jgi:hypothetical protein